MLSHFNTHRPKIDRFQTTIPPHPQQKKTVADFFGYLILARTPRTLRTYNKHRGKGLIHIYKLFIYIKIIIYLTQKAVRACMSMYERVRVYVLYFLVYEFSITFYLIVFQSVTPLCTSCTGCMYEKHRVGKFSIKKKLQKWS